jgi:hypothetical protein
LISNKRSGIHRVLYYTRMCTSHQLVRMGPAETRGIIPNSFGPSTGRPERGRLHSFLNGKTPLENCFNTPPGVSRETWPRLKKVTRD